VRPVVAEGTLPAKAVVGEQTPVRATVWCEGRIEIGASLVCHGPADAMTRRVPMVREQRGEDRWIGDFVPDATGMWTVWVEGWTDPWRTWRAVVDAKIDAGDDPLELANEFEAGARLLDRAADLGRDDDRGLLHDAAVRLRRGDLLLRDRLAAAASPAVTAVMADLPMRARVTAGPKRQFLVERERALYGAWYEFFPRSTGGRDARGRAVHGTFTTAAAELPRIAAMGFDIVYLPPIHPIGHRSRKGRDNSDIARSDDVGSPWAIGSTAGGHDAVHPDLGTMADFDAFVAAAGGLGLEVALDLALQCSPDHPWVTDHPEWFAHRPDGTIAHAENPPKHYRDVYPLDFDGDPIGLYREILRIVLFWVDHGVRVFRVDNPHTKPPAFWHWLIPQVRAYEPDVVFLAEAFTRPTVLHGLAKLGFSQSYTYFTWRDSKRELTEFGRELVAHADHLRPNLFVNTPDILPVALHNATPAAFAIRAALAATLSPSWGMYSGFELCEGEPLHEGAEEYLNSEKYELRPRDYTADRPDGTSLAPWLTRLNKIRRAHPAFRRLRTLRFHDTDADALLAYGRTDPATGDTVLLVVNLDPIRPTAGTVHWDLAALGMPPDARFTAKDEVDGRRYELGACTRVELDPDVAVARILAVMTS
jgi:starch synthase (maltosyl-transferring)